MSTQVGTLQRSRITHLIAPAIAVALIVAIAITLVATALSGDAVREEPNAPVRGASTTGVVGNNTPSEMGAAFGAFAQTPFGTAANTPSEVGPAAELGDGNAERVGPARFHPLP